MNKDPKDKNCYCNYCEKLLVKQYKDHYDIVSAVNFVFLENQIVRVNGEYRCELPNVDGKRVYLCEKCYNKSKDELEAVKKEHFIGYIDI